MNYTGNRLIEVKKYKGSQRAILFVEIFANVNVSVFSPSSGRLIKRKKLKSFKTFHLRW